ncbi:MAG: DUF1189 family protein [Bacilli bacterium]|nr:DUF1189 family protein [Bacilli bacterium]
MYTKFKECLLKPSKIGKYVDDKMSKTILYFILLLLIYILPSFVSLISVKQMPTDYSNVIVESFAKSSSINYKLENVNGKLNLNKTIDDAQPQYVEIGTIVGIDMNILVLFNTNESIDLNSYDFSSDLMNKNVILFTFAKEGMYISMGTLKLSNGSTDKTQELANTSNKQLYYSYEKLGLSEIDFSVASSNKTTFRNYLDNSYISMYQKNLALILLIGIPYILISGILSLLVEVLVLALLIKILYGRFNVHFGAICKIVILAYTPRVIFNLLSIFWSSIIMYFIGQFLTIIYVTIALRYYIIKNIGTNISNIIRGKDSSQGDNNNEL